MKQGFIYFWTWGLLLFPGCMADHRVSVADVDPAGWDATQPVEVRRHNDDTVSLSTLGVFLRYARTLPADELTLRIETRSPDSLMTVDTVVFRIPPPAVRVAAQKNADFHQTEQTFRSGVRLPKTGEYRFRIVPESEIRGVSAVGIVLQPENT